MSKYDMNMKWYFKSQSDNGSGVQASGSMLWVLIPSLITDHKVKNTIRMLGCQKNIIMKY